MLRQQRINRFKNEYFSLSDYIAPYDSGLHDYIGAFAISAGIGSDFYVHELKQNGDHYNSIMFRFVCDRLTEAFAEHLHERVRKEFWGYQKNEQLSKECLIKEKFQGIRPAPGYPACPDHSLKGKIFDMLNVTRNIGIKLTSSFVMQPVSSVSGFYIAHPQSRYFRIGNICKDQVEDYAIRMGWQVSEAEKWLAPILGYQTSVKV
jgi:5-methyltetrahydrofolate--homocysteine methyltransferase